MKNKYKWDRKWRLITGKDKNTQEHSLKEIDKYHCLVLLGEPGIGKTTELENLIEEDNNSLYINLRSIKSDTDFHHKIMKNEKIIKFLSSPKVQ